MSGSWPFPGDDPTMRARRVALAYRQALAAADPERCQALDATMGQLGQAWAVPRILTVEDDDWLSAADAAALALVEVATVKRWRLRGRLAGRQLGPRQWQYRAGDVLALATTVRTRGET